VSGLARYNAKQVIIFFYVAIIKTKRIGLYKKTVRAKIKRSNAPKVGALGEDAKKSQGRRKE
jgi:hypothetical protein